MDVGTPVIPLGDTVYNLFGFHHCGYDLEPFMRRRLAQGFNFLRVRVPVSPFHPPRGYSHWQTRRTQVWTGSEQSPNFHEFNLEWFRTVDEVMFLAEEVGMGIELIMEAWGFEFPWNHRTIFTEELEKHYLRYLLARYDAFTCLWWWTPMNEYEFYPDGQWTWKPEADAWLIRTANWIKATGTHNHPVAAHNGPRLPAFAQRFAADREAIDTIMFQEWGTSEENNAWLAAGIETVTRTALAGWWGTAVLAEWGYERNPEFANNVPAHQWLDHRHTRRGAYRAAFMKLGIAHGFENTWGPWCDLDTDLPGMDDLRIYIRFIHEVIPWLDMSPAPNLLPTADNTGIEPHALATDDKSVIAVYLPAGGEVALTGVDAGSSVWFMCATGEMKPATAENGLFKSPAVDNFRDGDAVLIIESATAQWRTDLS